MSEALWGRRQRPALGSGARVLGRWVPTSAAELTAHRRELAAAIDSPAPSPARESAVEQLLLAFEELASNGLRHGRDPVEVVVTAVDTGWLVEVSDASADAPPTPAVGRDPALGGLGLYLVAQVASAHGWTEDDDRKVVWARVDHARRPARSDVAGAVPHPRREPGGHQHWR